MNLKEYESCHIAFFSLLQQAYPYSVVVGLEVLWWCWGKMCNFEKQQVIIHSSRIERSALVIVRSSISKSQCEECMRVKELVTTLLLYRMFKFCMHYI